MAEKSLPPDEFKLPISTRAPRGPESEKGGLLGFRRSVDDRVIRMILATLTHEQRVLLRATSGNPCVASHLARLVESLLGAELVLGGVAIGELKEKLTSGQGGNSVDSGEDDD